MNEALSNRSVTFLKTDVTCSTTSPVLCDTCSAGCRFAFVGIDCHPPPCSLDKFHATAEFIWKVVFRKNFFAANVGGHIPQSASRFGKFCWCEKWAIFLFLQIGRA